ncbi:MAG: STAS/SEC14 domain-containing protein [Gammaproteobacteria bacterium]|nr:STAS/SEC14 domain-containing protein [Gammaproteobacteria bacterium]
MIDYELIPDPGILVIRPKEALKSSDFEMLTKATDDYITANGSLAGVCIQAQFFPGWENFGGFVSHLKFVKSQQAKVEKVAMVSNSTLFEAMPRLVDHFTNAEVRHFFNDELVEAMDWLRGHGS